jgi:hypothetical protein
MESNNNNSEILLMTDFVNLKIKLVQSFKCDHSDTVCVHVFIEMSIHMCMSICVCKKSHIMSNHIKTRGLVLAACTVIDRVC